MSKPRINTAMTPVEWAMLIGLSRFCQFRPEEGVAIEENGGKPHEGAVLFAHFGDGVFDQLDVVVGFLRRGRADQ